MSTESHVVIDPNGVCAYPEPGRVHTEANATAYLMCVVNVPGQVPVILTTPKYARDVADGVPGAVSDLATTALAAGVDVIRRDLLAMFPGPPSTKETA